MLLPNSEELTKRYYSIGEVAKMFEVNASLIRFWEKEFSQLHPKKNQRGKRMYTPKDIEMFKVIYHLLKEQGYTLEGAKRRLRENKEETLNVAAIAGRLSHIKEELIKIKDNL
ncbi:MAG: MerR family transcriptional regulator [Schleiferiaceae bacterium]|jgi:DNA-binding transcriptional MerR regulator|nr:MerR family transcriptional regulator [Schleiferiaceae bacterium]